MIISMQILLIFIAVQDIDLDLIFLRKEMFKWRTDKNRVKRYIDNGNRIITRFSFCLNKTQAGISAKL